MAEEKNQNTDSNTNPADNVVGGSGVQPVKKPKTPRQIERERERRRRRRQKKAEIKKDQQKPGKDVPLILTSKEGEEAAEIPPTDLTLEQELHPQPIKPVEKTLIPLQNLKPAEDEELQLSTKQAEQKENIVPVESEPAGGIQENQEKTEEQEEKAESNIPEVPASNESQPEEKIAPEEHLPAEDEHPVPPEPWMNFAEPQEEHPTETQGTPVVPEQESEPAETAESTQPEFTPEEHQYETQPEEDHASEKMHQLPEDQPIVVEPAETEPQEYQEEHHDLPHENSVEEENLKRARELSESILGAHDTLDELPPKPGLLGRLFDWLQSQVSKRRKEKPAETQISEAQPPQNPKPPFKFNLGWLWPLFKGILTMAVLVALVIGAYWLGSSLKIYDRIAGLFAPKPGQEQLAQGDNSKVIQDPAMLAKFGFQTSLIASKNGGNLADLTYNVFFNADYFGKLKEPVFFGETGISAALYYGFGKDANYLSNRFIYYVKYLDKLQNAYTVNIYDVMNGKVDREAALKKYLDDTNALFEQGNNLRKEINVQVDDLTVSLNTLNPDKDRYETDFFASLASLEAEQSDMLIKKFIEAAQKQVEIKAKLAAMSKLSQYYEQVLVNLKLRLDAVDKNQAALINGIQVTNIPGANLDLVKTQ